MWPPWESWIPRKLLTFQKSGLPRRVDFLGKFTSWKILLPGKVYFLGKFTSWESLLTRKFDFPKNWPIKKVCLPLYLSKVSILLRKNEDTRLPRKVNFIVLGDTCKNYVYHSDLGAMILSSKIQISRYTLDGTFWYVCRLIDFVLILKITPICTLETVVANTD